MNATYTKPSTDAIPATRTDDEWRELRAAIAAETLPGVRTSMAFDSAPWPVGHAAEVLALLTDAGCPEAEAQAVVNHARDVRSIDFIRRVPIETDPLRDALMAMAFADVIPIKITDGNAPEELRDLDRGDWIRSHYHYGPWEEIRCTPRKLVVYDEAGNRLWPGKRYRWQKAPTRRALREEFRQIGHTPEGAPIYKRLEVRR